MGKPCKSSHHTDQEFLRKFKILFDEIASKEDNTADEPSPTFTTFVDNFDVEDKLTKRLFECLLREHRRGRGRRSTSSSGSSRTGLVRRRVASDLNAWSQMFRRRQMNLDSPSDNSIEMSFRSAAPPMFSIRAGAGGTFEATPNTPLATSISATSTSTSTSTSATTSTSNTSSLNTATSNSTMSSSTGASSSSANPSSTNTPPGTSPLLNSRRLAQMAIANDRRLPQLPRTNTANTTVTNNRTD